MSDTQPNRAIATAYGTYLVQGLDRFAIGGDLDAEVTAAVADHHGRWGWPPKAVIWDDAVLSFRPYNLWFGLNRIFVPPADPFIAAALDSSARAAVRADIVPPEGLQTSDALAGLVWPGEVAQASHLARMIGWAGDAPLRAFNSPRPSHRAQSVSVVINYRDKADTTIACLHHLRRQRLTATLEIILVDNQSASSERMSVEQAASALFGAEAKVHHLSFDEPFNHSRQCNRAAGLATGEALLMLSNDCNLLDPDTLQTLADWAMEPGIGAVGPRLIGDDGLVACAGMALGPRMPGATELRVHEAEVGYLAGMIRRSNGASFACAAVARATWERMGGADASRFTIDYNDADFCLRLTKAGYNHLYVGTVRAHHHPGLTDVRTRAGTEALHAELAERHGIDLMPRLNPSALPIKSYPQFASGDALAICDFVRLYRRALEVRESGQVLPDALAGAFEELEAVARPGPGHDDEHDHELEVDRALRAVCAKFVASMPFEQVPKRYLESLSHLDEAFTHLAAGRARPVAGIDMPAEDYAAELLARQPVAPREEAARTARAPLDDPDRERQFLSHTDAGLVRAPTRLLVFADAFGPSQQILFLEGLRRARETGRCGVRIITEDDLARLRSFRGADRVSAWMGETIGHVRPTAILFSRFADADGYRAIRAAAGFDDVPHLCHIDDDFFTLPAVIGVDRYREARHPRRIHGLNLIATEADLILASTTIVAERLGRLFGARKVALCPMHEGGEPAPPRGAPEEAVIGYFGSATHNRDLEMIAPALRRLKAERPTLRIEIVGSVARRSAAAALGDIVVRRSDLEPDYAKFREAMRGWNWTVGLAPLMAHPFNAAKTPVKWTEYAAAGIPVIASRTEPYLELGRQGALLLASADEWHGRIAALLDSPARRASLLDTSDRLLRSFEGWARMERRLLGLLDRAGIRHRLASMAA